MSLVFAAILPHGPDIIAELAGNPDLMAETRDAMKEAGRRFTASRPETLILLDPHAGFMMDGAVTIGTAACAAGSLGGPNGREIAARFTCNARLAETLVAAGQGIFPLVRAEGEDGILPLSWGAMVPLWFTIGPMPEPRPTLVVIAPGSKVPRETLLRFGALIANVAAESGRRVALIASADQGHTHDANGLFGYSPVSAEHDDLYYRAVAENRLDRLLEISDNMLEEAWVDSFPQTLILAGALNAVAMSVDLLSYAVPTYYGMLVAVYEPQKLAWRP